MSARGKCQSSVEVVMSFPQAGLDRRGRDGRKGGRREARRSDGVDDEELPNVQMK